MNECVHCTVPGYCTGTPEVPGFGYHSRAVDPPSSCVRQGLVSPEYVVGEGGVYQLFKIFIIPVQLVS